MLKITDTEIEYQRWDNPDGPIYTIPAEDVFTITYQNGSKEVIRIYSPVSAWESIISTKTSISPTVGTYTNWAIAEPSSPYLRM